MINLSGKVALITGASRGIGEATARKLALYGAHVVLCARNHARVESICQEIMCDGVKALALKCDVTQYEDVAAAVKRCRHHFGSLDILVNNAGVIDPIARLAESDPQAWSDAVDTNLKGVYFGLRSALPVMESQGGGIIINMSSGAANSALEGWSHYCATKAAAKKLTECAHKEYADKGIRVVGLSPGTVATDMMATIKQSGINPVSQIDWSNHIPADWAAEAIAFLCTDEGQEFAGEDFSIKTEEGRKRVGLDRSTLTP